MSKVLDIYTVSGLKLTLKRGASSLGNPSLFIQFGVGVCMSAACENVSLVTYDSLPDVAFLEMPGCCIAFDPAFLGDIEAFLAELEGMAAA